MHLKSRLATRFFPACSILTRHTWVLSISIPLLLACAQPASGDPCTDSKACRSELSLRSGGTIPYYRTLALSRNEAVRRAVIVVHGNRRDADRYFDRLVTAASAEKRLQDTLLLAPNFRTEKDEPTSNEHHWSSHGWKIGNKSRDARRVSSFAVMDELFARVCPSNRSAFPNLEIVVVVGHSAGGQFVNRYAAGGAGCPASTLEVRYVVMNPSSYLYLDARRWSPTAHRFSVPDSDCRDYDDYKYGMRDLNSYMRRVGTQRIRANLFERATYYLAGEDDTRTGGSLDESCRGRLQGRNRLTRHANYRSYQALFGGWKGVFLTVPGIGHSGGRMLRSETARRVIFR